METRKETLGSEDTQPGQWAEATALARRLYLPAVSPLLRPAGVIVRARTFDSLRHRNFRLLWLASAGTSGGYFVQQLVVGWLVYDLTKSAFLTSLALGLDALPQLFVGPIGGVLVDVWDRRKLLIVLPIYQACVALAFSIVVLMGLAKGWHVFLFVVMMGFSWVLIEPSRMALTPQIVPRHKLVNAFALIQLSFSVTRLAGPATAGVLLAAFGPGPTLIVEVSLQLFASLMAFLIKTESAPKVAIGVRSVLAGLGEVARYFKANAVMPGLLLFAILSPLLVVPFTSGLMPVFAAEVFQVGPRELGLLLTAVGVGSVVGGMLLASLVDMRRKGWLLVFAALGTAAAMAVLSQNRNFALAVPNFVLIGAGFTVCQTLASALTQSHVREDLRGRVSGLQLATWGFSPAGALLSGVLADRYSASIAALTAAGLTAVLALALAYRFPSVRRLP